MSPVGLLLRREPPLLVTNNFEGGTNGSTIFAVTSGGGSGTNFDFVGRGAGATFTWDNAQHAHGSLSGAITGTSGTVTNCGFLNNINCTTVAIRMYIYFDTLPSTALRVMDIRNSGGSILRVNVTAANKFQAQEGGGSTLAFTVATAFSATTWYRLEALVTLISATAGTYSFDYYALDSTSPVETGISKNTGNLGTTNIVQLNYGSTANATWTGTMHIDDIAFLRNGTAYIGHA